MHDPPIIHADLDSFYASVEQRDDPGLRGRPVAVGGSVVLAASVEAKVLGVTSAMAGGRARRLCPDLVVVPPRFAAYVAASRAVFAILRDLAPVVEALSIDEAFLDVSGLEHISGTPLQIAHRLRARVREEVGLPITVGLAGTKFLAKVASVVAKPDGLLVVDPGTELAFLHPLWVGRLWGVGEKTSARLHAHGITTVGQIADAGEAALVELLGAARGRHLHALALARDPRPVRTTPRRRSIGAQRALGRRSRPWEEVVSSLLGLVDRVARRLRKGSRTSRTVVLRLRFGDYERTTRSRTLQHATAVTDVLAAAALALLRAMRGTIEERGLTLVGVSLTGLDDAQVPQLELPLRGAAALDAAQDQVHARYGAAALTRGSLVGRDLGESVPILRE